MALACKTISRWANRMPDSVSLSITRALPAALSRKWRVLPFRIAAGELYVAGSDLPGEEMQSDIRRFSSLDAVPEFAPHNAGRLNEAILRHSSILR